MGNGGWRVAGGGWRVANNGRQDAGGTIESGVCLPARIKWSICGTIVIWPTGAETQGGEVIMEVCGYLEKMQQLGEGERVFELVARWRVEYKHRPALLDELRKGFGG